MPGGSPLRSLRYPRSSRDAAAIVSASFLKAGVKPAQRAAGGRGPGAGLPHPKRPLWVSDTSDDAAQCGGQAPAGGAPALPAEGPAPGLPLQAEATGDGACQPEPEPEPERSQRAADALLRRQASVPPLERRFAMNPNGMHHLPVLRDAPSLPLFRSALPSIFANCLIGSPIAVYS